MNTEKVRNKLAALTEKEKYFERNLKKSEKTENKSKKFRKWY